MKKLRQRGNKPRLRMAAIMPAVIFLIMTFSAAGTAENIGAAENTGIAENTDIAENVSGSVRGADHENVTGFSRDAAPLSDPMEVRAERLPERWYAGDCGKKPTVRHQGSDGTCWALAAASALEAALLPEQHIVFSADHMVRKNAFTVETDEGGDYLMAMAYLSGWQGPVTEEQDPYGDGTSPDGLTPAVHVQEIQLLEDAKPGTIKTAVREYGAVQTSLYMRRSADPVQTEDSGESADGSAEHENEQAVFYYNENTRAYFCPDERTPNHDVIILGWDDSYSRFLFSNTPERDGAFICQNTWERGFGEDGIFYVSYEDSNIAKSCVVYSGIEPADNYSRILQYDDCGWQGRQGYADETCWFANVYSAVGGESGEQSLTPGDGQSTEQSLTPGDGQPTEQQLRPDGGQSSGDELPSSGGGESLAAVGFYAVGPDTSYEIYLVRDFRDAADFAEREYLQGGKLRQSGKLQNAGYYTVKLDEPQLLAPGERFAVVVKITTPGEENPVAVEYRADEYTQNVTTEGKESYLSRYGDIWENTQERFGTNVCLKAYMLPAAE